jgi:hypothetical protein
MSAADAASEIWKRIFSFLAFVAVTLAFLTALWYFFSYADKVLEQRDARIQAQQALAAWSGTGGASGAIRLSEVSADDLEPCTVAKVYYANGTLAKEVRTPCP